ncbi:MAG: replication-relaxation family protein [Verrucomicrobiota bacterium]
MPIPRNLQSIIALQPRDLSILRTLFECRVFTTTHAASLFFNGRKEAAKKRLQILKRAGLIAERPRAPSEPAVLYLSRKGLETLRDDGILSEYPAFDLPTLLRRAQVGSSTIRHELEVMDAKVAFHEAVKAQPNLSLPRFSTWPLLNSFTVSHPKGKGAKVLVLPDGYFEIHETASGRAPKIHRFFLEMDRSTESLETLVSRSASYFAHYRSGGFAKSQGGDRATFRSFPFRVLIVVSSSGRRDNLLEALIATTPPIYSIAWIATRDDLLRNPLNPIWSLPNESRSSTARSTHSLIS